jgi:ABC-2 type transport system ATP-binding protein
MATAGIQTIGLVKRFQSSSGWRALVRRGQPKIALDRVELCVEPGEIFGLLGPNGAGKTTLVKVLSTLILPTAGRASVAGLDVVERAHDVRRRIGVVYGDERTFYLRLSGVENLRFYASLYGIPRAEANSRIGRLLDLVGLSAAADVRMHHYSTGMRQRMAIARGLLPDPEILFLDEPTRTLDPVASRDLRDLVRERVANGRRTVLLATNIMAEAEQLCDRLAFLSRGRVLFTGSIGEMQRLFQTDESHLIVVSHIERCRLERLRLVPGVESLDVTGAEDGTLRVEVAVARSTPTLPLLIRRIAEEGGEIWSSTPRALSLDEMFRIAIHNVDIWPREETSGVS